MGLIIISIILIIIILDQKRKWKSMWGLVKENRFFVDEIIFLGATRKDLLIDSRHFIISTFKQMRSIKQLLLLPLAFWIGTSLGFVFAIYTSVSKMSNYLSLFILF